MIVYKWPMCTKWGNFASLYFGWSSWDMSSLVLILILNVAFWTFLGQNWKFIFFSFLFVQLFNMVWLSIGDFKARLPWAIAQALAQIPLHNTFLFLRASVMSNSNVILALWLPVKKLMGNGYSEMLFLQSLSLFFF